MSDNPLAAIAAMEARVMAAIAQVGTDLMARLDRLQTSVDATRDDITVAMGANDATRKAGDNTRDEVRDLANQVAAMQRIILKHGTRLDEIERRRP